MIIEQSPTVYNTGHKVGQFFSSPCNRFAYIPIPKCASTWASKFLTTGLDWLISDSKNIKTPIGSLFYEETYSCTDAHKLVILRNPLDRWASGMAQYLAMKHPGILVKTRELQDFIFGRIDFDPHTVPQVNYLSDLDTDDITFFRFDDKLEQNLKTWIKTNTYKESDIEVFRNDSKTIKNKYMATQNLKSLLECNDVWLEAVKTYYKLDIELYNTVKFYGI